MPDCDPLALGEPEREALALSSELNDKLAVGLGGTGAREPAADGDVALSRLVGVAVSEEDAAAGPVGVVLAAADPLPAALLELAAEADALLLAPVVPDIVPVQVALAVPLSLPEVVAPVAEALADRVPGLLLEATPAPPALEVAPGEVGGDAVPLAAVAVDVLVQLAVRAPLAVAVALDEGTVVVATCTATLHAYVLLLSQRTAMWYVEPARPTPCACLSAYAALALPPGAMVYVRHSQSLMSQISAVFPTQRNELSDIDGAASTATASVTVYRPLTGITTPSPR